MQGSPIMVVPPPIRAMGLLPACCRRFMKVSATKWPAVRLSAVQSKGFRVRVLHQNEGTVVFRADKAEEQKGRRGVS